MGKKHGILSLLAHPSLEILFLRLGDHEGLIYIATVEWFMLCLIPDKSNNNKKTACLQYAAELIQKNCKP